MILPAGLASSEASDIAPSQSQSPAGNVIHRPSSTAGEGELRLAVRCPLKFTHVLFDGGQLAAEALLNLASCPAPSNHGSYYRQDASAVSRESQPLGIADIVDASGAGRYVIASSVYAWRLSLIALSLGTAIQRWMDYRRRKIHARLIQEG
jgi:hypothetical protein